MMNDKDQLIQQLIELEVYKNSEGRQLYELDNDELTTLLVDAMKRAG
ncbi:Fur-regulated basic protein FbpA [Desertibacillus haloalkaliphilus]|nr:Fur-regulated basic protein FbpA [Desertibacillus haloalkaliphilus]MBU8908113.1 Fur-regulated basic protein FbpA [Desertibacillus haloalkaliphilus]